MPLVFTNKKISALIRQFGLHEHKHCDSANIFLKGLHGSLFPFSLTGGKQWLFDHYQANCTWKFVNNVSPVREKKSEVGQLIVPVQNIGGTLEREGETMGLAIDWTRINGRICLLATLISWSFNYFTVLDMIFTLYGNKSIIDSLCVEIFHINLCPTFKLKGKKGRIAQRTRKCQIAQLHVYCCLFKKKFKYRVLTNDH